SQGVPQASDLFVSSNQRRQRVPVWTLALQIPVRFYILVDIARRPAPCRAQQFSLRLRQYSGTLGSELPGQSLSGFEQLPSLRVPGELDQETGQLRSGVFVERIDLDERAG